MPNKKKSANKHSVRPPKGGTANVRDKGDQLARDVGKRIFEAREGLGWSQQILAFQTKLSDSEKQGVSRAVLSLYENGINKPGAREIRLLCEALKVTPNWLLYGSDSPAKTLQASMSFLQGSEVKLTARLSFAILALEPEDRDSIAALVLSLLNKKIGDIQLSSLMTMASFIEDRLLAEIVNIVGEDAKTKPVREVLELFVKETGSAIYTNAGNLRPAIPEDKFDEFDGSKPPPPRTLKNQ